MSTKNPSKKFRTKGQKDQLGGSFLVGANVLAFLVQSLLCDEWQKFTLTNTETLRSLNIFMANNVSIC